MYEMIGLQVPVGGTSQVGHRLNSSSWNMRDQVGHSPPLKPGGARFLHPLAFFRSFQGSLYLLAPSLLPPFLLPLWDNGFVSPLSARRFLEVC